MELFVVLALLLLGFSLLRRRSYTPPDPAAAPAVIHKIVDPALSHRTLVENADDFSNRPVAPFLRFLADSHGGRRGDSLNTVRYGPVWRAFRRNLTAETLHPSRLGYLAPLQRDGVQALVAALGLSAGAGAVTVREHFVAAVFPVVARLCFGDGIKECDVSAISYVTRRMQQLAIGEVRASPASVMARLGEWRRLRQLLDVHRRTVQLLLPLIAARRESRGPCDGRRPYVDSLIDLRVPTDDGSKDGVHDGWRAVGDDEMVNLAWEFLGAGTGTIVTCLEWTLGHLVDQQEVQKKLRDEVDSGDVSSRSFMCGMPYLNAVVMESLRMHPPVPFMQRDVQGDAAARVFGGTGLPAGDWHVQYSLGDMGRDKKTWKDPDVFRPERFLPGGEAEDTGRLPGPKEIRMMPFGAGHRFCPGVGLAMVNIKCFLAALVREFEWTPPTKDRGRVDLTEVGTFIKMMRKPLSARLTRRT